MTAKSNGNAYEPILERNGKGRVKISVRAIDYREKGLSILRKTFVAKCNLSRRQIEYLGKCAYENRRIILGKDRNTWVLDDYSKDNVRKYKYHGYIIQGENVTPLQKSKHGTFESIMREYEARDTSRPLHKASTEEIWNAGKVCIVRKKKSSGGSYTPNPRLRGMSMSRREYELNSKPRFSIYIAGCRPNQT